MPILSTPPNHKSLFYFADPMCSWCWGFSPVIHEIESTYGAQAPIEVIMGGLRRDRRSIDDKMRNYLQSAWSSVSEKSGQPFKMDMNFPSSFVYNTTNACRGVVAAQQLSGTSGLDALTALQRAFYTQNKDISNTTIIADVLATVTPSFAAQEIENTINSEAVQEETERQFDATFEMGIGGFPSLVGIGGKRPVMLTHGFQPLAQLHAAIEPWLNS